MRKVIVGSSKTNTVLLGDIGEDTPIFAKKDGKTSGMIVHENSGWILRIGGERGCTGHYDTRKTCIENAEDYKYIFFVE